MARRINAALKGQRDKCVVSLALARNYASTMGDKCRELEALSQSALAGHVIGDKIVADATRSVVGLAQACSRLAEAGNAAMAIDVTEEVPDPPSLTDLA